MKNKSKLSNNHLNFFPKTFTVMALDMERGKWEGRKEERKEGTQTNRQVGRNYHPTFPALIRFYKPTQFMIY